MKKKHKVLHYSKYKSEISKKLNCPQYVVIIIYLIKINNNKQKVIL